MLVHFAKDNKRVEAVQIPRDTLTTLPACKDTGSGAFAGGANLMINSALAGGPACSVRAVEALSNVQIDHFVQLDFDGFASMVNALGGVNVCLDKPMVDPDAKLNLPAGKQKLNGKNALALARTRHAVGDGSDIGRLGHQQVVMSSIIGRARSAGVLTRPDRLFKFLNALTSSITVDEGISSIPKLTGLAKRPGPCRTPRSGSSRCPTARRRPTPTGSSRPPMRTRSSPRSPRIVRSRSRARTPRPRRHPRPRQGPQRRRHPGPRLSGQTALAKEGYVVSGIGRRRRTRQDPHLRRHHPRGAQDSQGAQQEVRLQGRDRQQPRA